MAYVSTESNEGRFADTRNRNVYLGPDRAKHPVRVFRDHVTIGDLALRFDNSNNVRLEPPPGGRVLLANSNTDEHPHILSTPSDYWIGARQPGQLQVLRGPDWQTACNVTSWDAQGNLTIASDHVHLAQGRLALTEGMVLQGDEDGSLDLGNHVQIDSRGKIGLPNIQSAQMNNTDVQLRGHRDRIQVYYGDDGSRGYALTKDCHGSLTWAHGPERDLKPTVRLLSEGDVEFHGDVYQGKYQIAQPLRSDTPVPADPLAPTGRRTGREVPQTELPQVLLLARTDAKDLYIVGTVVSRAAELDLILTPTTRELNWRGDASITAGPVLIECKVDSVRYLAIDWPYDRLIREGQWVATETFCGTRYAQPGTFIERARCQDILPLVDTESSSTRATHVTQNADTYIRSGQLAVHSSNPLTHALEVGGDAVLSSNQASLFLEHVDPDQANGVIFISPEKEGASLRYWDSSNSLVVNAARFEVKGDVLLTSNARVSNQFLVDPFRARPSYTWSEGFSNTGAYLITSSVPPTLAWCIEGHDTAWLETGGAFHLLPGAQTPALTLGQAQLVYDGGRLEIGGLDRLTSFDTRAARPLDILRSHAACNYLTDRTYTGPDAGNIRNVLDDGTGNTRFVNHFCNAGSALVSVMGGTDGGTEHGIRMANIDDPDWGLYLGTSNSMAGSNASVPLPLDSTIFMGQPGELSPGAYTPAMRMRAPEQTAFVWENSSNERALLSLGTTQGDLHLNYGPLRVHGDVASFEHAIYGGKMEPQSGGTPSRWVLDTWAQDPNWVIWGNSNWGAEGYALRQATEEGHVVIDTPTHITLAYQDAKRLRAESNCVRMYVPVEITAPELRFVRGDPGISRIDLQGARLTFGEDARCLLATDSNAIELKSPDSVHIQTPVTHVSKTLETKNNLLDDGEGGTAQFAEDVEIARNLFVSGPLVNLYNANLNVASNSVFQSNLVVQGDLHVAGSNIELGGNVDLSSNLKIAKDIYSSCNATHVVLNAPERASDFVPGSHGTLFVLCPTDAVPLIGTLRATSGDFQAHLQIDTDHHQLHAQTTTVRVSLVEYDHAGQTWYALWFSEQPVPRTLVFTGIAANPQFMWLPATNSPHQITEFAGQHYLQNADLMVGPQGRVGVNMDIARPEAQLDVRGTADIYDHLRALSNVTVSNNLRVLRGDVYVDQGDLRISGYSELLGGGLYAVMNDYDGGEAHGIRLMNASNPDWGLYLASSVSQACNMAGTAIPVAGYDFEGSAVRLRARGKPDHGYIWENSDDVRLMSLNAESGRLAVRDQILAGTSFAFTADPQDVRLRNPQSHTFTCEVAGNERVRLDQTGLKIDPSGGTSSPEVALDVYGDQQASRDIFLTANTSEHGLWSARARAQNGGAMFDSHTGHLRLRGGVPTDFWAMRDAQNTVRLGVAGAQGKVWTSSNTLDDGKGSAYFAGPLVEVHGNLKSDATDYSVIHHAASPSDTKGPGIFLICRADTNARVNGTLRGYTSYIDGGSETADAQLEAHIRLEGSGAISDAYTSPGEGGSGRADAIFITSSSDAASGITSQGGVWSLVTCTYNGNTWYALAYESEHYLPDVIDFGGYLLDAPDGLKWVGWFDVSDLSRITARSRRRVQLQSLDLCLSAGARLGVNVPHHDVPEADLEVDGDVLVRKDQRVEGTSCNIGGMCIGLMNGETSSGSEGPKLYGIRTHDYNTMTDMIYQAKSGAVSPEGATCAAGYDFEGQALRMRMRNTSNAGFIWENATEQALMSLNAHTGRAWLRDTLILAPGVSNAPALELQHDTIRGTGLYGDPTDYIALSVKGSPVLRTTAAGNVGICGQAASREPSADFEVDGSALINSNLEIEGQTTGHGLATFADGLRVARLAEVQGDLRVLQSSTFQDHVYIKADGDMFLCNDLYVEGTGFFGDQVKILGRTCNASDVEVVGRTDLWGNTIAHQNWTGIGPVTFCNSIDAWSNLHLHGSLLVDSNTTLGASLMIESNLTVQGNVCNMDTVNCYGLVTAHSNALFKDSVTMSGPDVTVQNRLRVEGNTCNFDSVWLDSNLTVNDISRFVGNSTFERDMTIIGAQTVLGPTVFAGPLNTVSNDLRVEGNTCNLGDTWIGSNLRVHGQTVLVDPVTTKSTLYVTDAQTCASNLYVLGDQTALDGILTVSNAVYARDDLEVSSNALVRSNLTVLGDAAFSQDLSTNGALNVQGDVQFASTLGVSNDVTFQDDLKVHGVTSNLSHTHIDADLHVNGITYLSNVLRVKDNVYLENQLDVSRDTVLHDDLKVYGTTSNLSHTHIDADLHVNGITFLSNELRVENDVQFGNRLDVSNDVTFQDDLKVYGTTSNLGHTLLNDSLHVNGISFLSNDLRVQSNTYLGNQLNVSNYVTFQDNLKVHGVTSNLSHTYVNDSLHVTGTTHLSNDLRVKNNANLGSQLNVSNDTTLQSGLYVKGNVQFGNQLGVSNDVTFQDDLKVHGVTSNLSHTYVNDSLHVTGTTHLSNDLQVKNNANLGGQLNVSNDVTFQDDLKVYGVTSNLSHTYVNDSLHVNGISFLSNDLRVQGNADLGSQLNVSNYVTFQDSLKVYGTTSNLGHTYVNNSLHVNGISFLSNDLRVQGNTDLGNQLNVSNDTTLQSGLYVKDIVEFGSQLGVSNYVTFQDNLKVHGVTSNLGHTHINNSLDVSGNTYLSGDLYVNNKLDIGSQLNVSNDVTLKDDLKVEGTTSNLGHTYIDNTLFVKNAVTFDDSLHVSTNTDMNGSLSVNDVANFGNAINVSNYSTFQSGFEANGSVRHNGNVNIQDDVFANGSQVGIGTLNPTNKLHVIGDIFSSGNVRAASDLRLKQNLTPIPDALNKVSQLTGYTFSRSNVPHVRQAGLVAQEVMKVLPEVVDRDPIRDEYNLAYGNIVALLVEAIKDLKTEVEKLIYNRNTH